MSEETRTHRFEAETQKILDLVVHSLYSDRQVFLRELISNASDALDRVRYLALQRDDLVAPEGEPGVTLRVDKDARTLTIGDNGVGMTRDEAVKNLGTIAHSGTRAFAAAAQAGQDGAKANLIGQFGVGFYSAFMVAHKVTVHTLSALPGAEPVLWEAEGGDTFSVTSGTRTTRGTEITLHLKDDATDYLDPDHLRDIVRFHSDFLAFPILLDGEQVNRGAALWTRTPKDITEDEYAEFYKHVSGDWQGPLLRAHFSSDAPYHHHALLYVPKKRPTEIDYPGSAVGVKLYCRRVLVVEEARDMLPRYLRFLRGVLESDDLDLNVSRELLQRTSVAGVLRKQVVSRTLKRFKELARDDAETWGTFWREFGSILKEGIHEDDANRENLTALLRFETTKGEGLRSLQEVADGLPADEEHLWYLTGLDKDRLAQSPLLERFRRKGIEVLLMSDPVDEWVVLHVREFAGKKLKSVARGDLEDEIKDDPIAEAARTQARPLLDWLKDLFQGEVADVRPSSRLTDSPSVLVDRDGGLGSNLERILSVTQKDMTMSPRVLEINVEHPIVKKLARVYSAGDSTQTESLARLLLDHARLAEGEVRDPVALVSRLQKVMLQALSGLGGRDEPATTIEAAPVAAAAASPEAPPEAPAS